MSNNLVSINKFGNFSRPKKISSLSYLHGLFFGFLLFIIFLVILYLYQYWYSPTSFIPALENPLHIKREFEKPDERPALTTDEGTPIRVENRWDYHGKNDITENKYLTLYGKDNSRGYQGIFDTTGTYYPRDNWGYNGENHINHDIIRENKYIHDVNRRIREINKNRQVIEDPYRWDKNKLKYVRNIERRLANKVHHEENNYI